MTTPDQGAEFGWERGHWDAQLAISNGAGGSAPKESGKQYSGQLAYVESRWRLGLAANFNDKSEGSKSAYGLFGGLRTGPVAWLGQVELTDDQSAPNGGRRMLAGLLEADWRIAAGHNLKLTAELMDPNRSIRNDNQTRWSIVYELTPIQFVQLRAGVRILDGIPQIDTQHSKFYFVQLHGFF
jgi:hypothetical protein